MVTDQIIARIDDAIEQIHGKTLDVKEIRAIYEEVGRAVINLQRYSDAWERKQQRQKE